MSLGHGMLVCLILRRAIDGPDFALAGNTAFKLCLYFLRAPLLEWIGATADDERPCDCEQLRQAFHLRILGSKRAVARVVAVEGLKS